MLHRIVVKLLNDLNQMQQYYHKAKEGESFNFVMHVQPFTEKVDRDISDISKYNEQIIQLKLMNEMKYKLMIQHLKELSVECFFSKTSKKVFIDKYKAVQHDLQYMEREFRS